MNTIQSPNARRLSCPLPMLKPRKVLDAMNAGGALQIITTDSRVDERYQCLLPTERPFPIVDARGGKGTYFRYMQIVNVAGSLPE